MWRTFDSGFHKTCIDHENFHHLSYFIYIMLLKSDNIITDKHWNYKVKFVCNTNCLVQNGRNLTLLRKWKKITYLDRELSCKDRNICHPNQTVNLRLKFEVQKNMIYTVETYVNMQTLSECGTPTLNRSSLKVSLFVLL